MKNIKFFTEEGLNSLEARMKSFIDLFNNHYFPFEAPMIGFGKFRIESKEECKNRIKELASILNLNIQIEIKKEKINGEIKIKEKMIYGI